MRIQMNQALVIHAQPSKGLAERTYFEDQQYDVDDLTGRQWTHAGIATAVTPQQGAQ